MKKLLLSSLFTIFSLCSFGQTASNFNCNDCSNVNHDLFSELNGGKVVVICWVMPCSSCISDALAAQSACQNFSSSNPGQVYYYVADDAANTSCSTLSSWCNTNGITGATAKFSNSAISMSDYGASGMPKVVVLGSAGHTVYYNENDVNVTTSGIQSAISSALSAVAAGIKDNNNSVFISPVALPNPSKGNCKLSYNLTKSSNVVISIQNQLGQKVMEVFNGYLQQGEHTGEVNTSDFSSGIYFINFSDGEVNKKLKLFVIN